jgi:hypothetical protein
MFRRNSLTAVLLALTVFAWRASAEEVRKAIWEQQADLKLDHSPLLLADRTESEIIETPGGEWHFRAGVSMWGAAITGTAGNRQTEVDVDAGLGEFFDNSTLGLEFNFEAGTGQWSFLLAGMWMHLGDHPTTPAGLDADLDGDYGFLDIAAAYELRRVTVRGKTVALDGLLGLRWTSVSANIEIEEGPTPRPRRDDDKDFVDPYLGLRARWYISELFNLTTTGTVGGLGIGSDLLATGEVMLEYRFDDTWSLLAGYRGFYYDYDDNFEWNVLMHGPVIGVAARW